MTDNRMVPLLDMLREDKAETVRTEGIGERLMSRVFALGRDGGPIVAAAVNDGDILCVAHAFALALHPPILALTMDAPFGTSTTESFPSVAARFAAGDPTVTDAVAVTFAETGSDHATIEVARYRLDPGRSITWGETLTLTEDDHPFVHYSNSPPLHVCAAGRTLPQQIAARVSLLHELLALTTHDPVELTFAPTILRHIEG